LLHVPAIPKGCSKKMTLKWHGPYRPYKIISEKQGRQFSIEILKKDSEGRPVIKKIHEARLKKYHSRYANMIVSPICLQVKVNSSSNDWICHWVNNKFR
jgi:hypothetical protein